MSKGSSRRVVSGLALALFAGVLMSTGPVLAEDGKQSFGGIEPGKWVLGMRAGFAPVTQTVSEVPGFRTSTDVGSLVNFQAMYSLNKWLLVGMMLEGAGMSSVVEDCFIRSACTALSRSVLLGIVPRYTQPPPTPGSRSIMATCLPLWRPGWQPFGRRDRFRSR